MLIVYLVLSQMLLFFHWSTFMHLPSHTHTRALTHHYYSGEIYRDKYIQFTVNPHIGEAAQRQCVAFLLKNQLKRFINYQKSLQLNFCQMTNYFNCS